MQNTIVRLLVLAVLSGALWLAVSAGCRFVESRRRRALQAMPVASSSSVVRILAFGSEECAQCHRMQTPALRRVQEARPDIVVEEIDAPTSPELTRRYSVLTLPTTVVLDAAGRPRAVNYGFANSQRLLQQIDAAWQPADSDEQIAEVVR